MSSDVLQDNQGGGARVELWFLPLMIFIAFVLRARGLSDFALHHWDEGLAWRGALWFASGTSEGHYSPTHAPPLVSLVFGMVEAAGRLFGTSGPKLVVWVNVLASVALVPVGYGLAREIANRQAGRLAAIAFALSPLHVEFARTLLTDTLYSLWLLLTLAAGLRALRRESPWGYLVAGVCAALLQATKYNGFIVLAPLGLLALWLRRGTSHRLRDAALLVAPVVLVIAGNLAAIAALGDLSAFFEHYSGYIGAGTRARELAATLIGMGFVGVTPSLLVVLGAVLLVVVRPTSRGLLAVGTALLYLVFAARYTLYLRLLVPVVSLGWVVLAAGWGRSVEGSSKRSWGFAALLLGAQVVGLLEPRYARRAGFDGYPTAIQRLNEIDTSLPRLVAGQEFVWEGLEGELHFGSPWRPALRELLTSDSEVIVIYDVGAFSRLRDWNLEGLHAELKGRGSRVTATLGWDCLQNNLGWEGVQRLETDADLRDRVLFIHWVRIAGNELAELLEKTTATSAGK